LINAPPSSGAYDFTKFALKSWENLKDADKFLEGYKKKLDYSPIKTSSSSSPFTTPMSYCSTSSFVSPPSDFFKG
jgi:hypothetical protein